MSGCARTPRRPASSRRRAPSRGGRVGAGGGPLRALVPRSDLGRVRIVRVRGEPAFCRLPVQALVAIPVVLRGRDQRDDGKAGGLEGRDRPLERRPRLYAIRVVLRQRQRPPVRLAYHHVATRAHGWRKGVDRVGEAAVHEARAEAERRVVRLLPRSCVTLAASPSSNETHRHLPPPPPDRRRQRGTRARSRGRATRAAVRPTRAERPVRRALTRRRGRAIGAEPRALPEEEQLLLRGRILDLMGAASATTK